MAKFTKTIRKQTSIIHTRFDQSIGKVNRGIGLYEATGHECERFHDGQNNGINNKTGNG